MRLRESFERHGQSLAGMANILGPDRRKWADEANLGWHIDSAAVLYRDGVDEKTGKPRTYSVDDRRVLYRADTKQTIGIVSSRFKPVQPVDVLDLFAGICEQHGFVMELAGSCQNSTLIWVMARTPYELVLPGNDEVFNYLTLLTANNGTRSTMGFLSTLRLDCTNQLPMIVRKAKLGTGPSIARLTHAQEFTTVRMEAKLSKLDREWASFSRDIRKLAAKKVTPAVANEFYQLVCKPDLQHIVPAADLAGNSVPLRMMDTYMKGDGQANIVGTAWGLVQGLTRFLDHERKNHSDDARIHAAWFGPGRKTKALAFEHAMAIADGTWEEVVADRR